MSDKLQVLNYNPIKPPGRILIGAYLFNFNTTTLVTSITPLRTFNVHYNGTDAAFDQDLCVNCILITAHDWAITNSVHMTVNVTNNYEDEEENTFKAYDPRIILVQLNTDGDEELIYDELEVIAQNYTYSCYTDIWFPPTSSPPTDQDSSTNYGRTNPFIPIYFWGTIGEDTYFMEDRVLPQGQAYTTDFDIAINSNANPPDEGDVQALIMVDVCQRPPIDMEPNCAEPYDIRFDDPEAQFPEVIAGISPLGEVDFMVYDHQCDQGEPGYDYEDDITGEIHFWPWDENDSDIFGPPVVDYDSSGTAEAGQGYTYELDPDYDALDSGLYPGIIEMTDSNATYTLKQKIWVTLRKATADSYDFIDDYGMGSSPVKADVDNDGILDTVFTTDATLWALGSDWTNEKQEYYQGQGNFIGTPSIVGDKILLAWKYAIWQILRVDGDDPSTIEWESGYDGGDGILTEPITHPIPVDVDDDSDLDVFVVCRGGFVDMQTLESPSFYVLDYSDGDLLATGPDEDRQYYFGPPAIFDDGNTKVAMIIRKEFNGSNYKWYLEAWDLDDLSVELDSVLLGTYYDSNGYEDVYTPTIGKDGSTWVIYTPTYDEVHMHKWNYNSDVFYDSHTADLPDDTYNVDGLIVVGDMNHDGKEDLVVPHHGGVTVYTGYVSDANLCLNIIWSYLVSDNVQDFYHFHIPTLIDCNGDTYLDVIAGVGSGGESHTHKVAALDGSPFNNHNRADTDDREMWIWDRDFFPQDNYSGYYCRGWSTALSRTDDNDTLRITLLMQNASLDIVCWSVDTNFHFNWDSNEGSSKCRAPWLKQYFSLDNWNNFHADYPEYEEGG